MPEKGFTALTVKDEYADRIRACYRSLADGTGYPVVLDKEAYEVIEELIAKKKVRTADQAANALIKAQGNRGGVTLSMPEDLRFLAHKFLSMETERDGLETLSDLLIYALQTFLSDKLSVSPESIWHIDDELYLVGDVYHPESVETWILLVKRMLKGGARVQIVEWRRPDSVVPTVSGRYWAYLGAEINNTCFVVGGMNNFSGSGMAAYQSAQNFLEDIRYEPVIKDSRDPLFQHFIDMHDNLVSMQPMQRWQKLRTINDLTKPLRHVERP